MIQFVQICPVIASSSATINTTTKDYYDLNVTLGINISTILYLTHSVLKTPCLKNVLDCFDSTNPHHTQWKEAAFEQYDKNSTYGVFTKPIPISTLLPNLEIFCLVLVPSVKPTDIPSIWKLGLCHCVNGKPLKGMNNTIPPLPPRSLHYSFSFNSATLLPINFLTNLATVPTLFNVHPNPTLHNTYFATSLHITLSGRTSDTLLILSIHLIAHLLFNPVRTFKERPMLLSDGNETSTHIYGQLVTIIIYR